MKDHCLTFLDKFTFASYKSFRAHENVLCHAVYSCDWWWL